MAWKEGILQGILTVDQDLFHQYTIQEQMAGLDGNWSVPDVRSTDSPNASMRSDDLFERVPFFCSWTALTLTRDVQ
jgi:hypothetical protein